MDGALEKIGERFGASRTSIDFSCTGVDRRLIFDVGSPASLRLRSDLHCRGVYGRCLLGQEKASHLLHEMQIILTVG